MYRPDWGGWPLAVGSLALVVAGCGAIDWALEPYGTRQETACACPATDAPTRADVAVRAATRVGGVLTGNPVAWTLAGQLVHVLLGAVAGRRNRPTVPTGRPASG